MHKTIQSPCLSSGRGSVPSEGRVTPPLPHPGDHHPRHRKNRGSATGSISAMEENTMSLLISAYKRTLRPPPRTAAAGPPPNLQEGGQRAIFQRPPVYLGNKPTPPGGREASEAAQRASLLSRRRQRLPRPTRPSPPRRPRPRPRKGRGGERGAAAPVPRSPPTSCSRARQSLPGLPLPSPREGRARAPGSTVERRPRPREPLAAREAGTLGLPGGQRLPPEPARTPGA